MSEHLEKQNAESARQQRSFEDEQRKIWTPTSLLEQCCLQWLSRGPYQMIRSGNNLASVTHRGCSGGCSKAHPKIKLDFVGGVGTASISHALDPFTQLFKDDPMAKTTVEQPLKYQLNGMLSDHHERIKQKFGAHLVSVEHRALAASQRAYERQLEQEDIQQAAKKRKVMGEAAPINLLESVLEICYNNSIGEYLDVADIAWMRTSCKSMGKIAARMARDRMRAIKLLYAAYSPTQEAIRCVSKMNQLKIPLSLDMAAADLSVLCPGEPHKSIDWRCCGDNDVLSIIRIEIYLNMDQSAIPERSILFENHYWHDNLEVARYQIDSRNFREEGEVFKGQSNVQEESLGYRVTSFDLDESLPGITSSQGKIILQSIVFTFDDLLGVYVRMRLYNAKREYSLSTIKKPADKAYIKALAKAAREAPGDARSFRGMAGWDSVYR